MVRVITIIFALISSITACSSAKRSTTIIKKEDIQSIAKSTVISVMAKEDFPLPKGAQSFVKMGKFEVNENVYDAKGQKLLLPRHTIIEGLYSNDGSVCEIEWGVVYMNEVKYKAREGVIDLSFITDATLCSPSRGVKKGDKLIITYNQNLIDKPFNE